MYFLFIALVFSEAVYRVRMICERFLKARTLIFLAVHKSIIWPSTLYGLCLDECMCVPFLCFNAT